MNEELEYTALRRLGQKLHIPVPEAFLELEVRDKDGKLVQRLRQRSHSWTRNAYNLIFSELASKNVNDATFEAGKLSGKDTTGTVQYGAGPAIIGKTYNTSVDGTYYGYRAAAADDTKGILVGSGTNAESFEDYALQTKIANGTGAGQLSHVESEPHSISYVGTTLKNELVRYFNNNSGGSVDVKEVALVTEGSFYTSDVYYLMSRDKLASTITVPDTGQLKVIYTIQLTYPA